MGVDEPRQHQLALQIDQSRGVLLGFEHLFVRAHAQNPLASDGNRLSDGEFPIDCRHLAVVEDKVDRLILGCSPIGDQHGDTRQNCTSYYSTDLEHRYDSPSVDTASKGGSVV
jgi:hypothetical protein